MGSCSNIFVILCPVFLHIFFDLPFYLINWKFLVFVYGWKVVVFSLPSPYFKKFRTFFFLFGDVRIIKNGPLSGKFLLQTYLCKSLFIFNFLQQWLKISFMVSHKKYLFS